jgi:2,3-bisphosphoglycerate-independent phosphoglycerate mutase
MVGHTGVFDAIVRAVEATDTCLGSVLNACIELGYKALVIADHGNAEFAVNDDGSPNTAHTMNPVPCILVDASGTRYRLKDGVLADIAPTILYLMGIQKPVVMTGSNLIEL